MNADIAAVIPVRKGSSRIKNKVLLPFGQDLSLLSWKITQLCEVMPKEKIYVSTECDELKAVAKSLGVQVHNRDEYLARGHDATFSEVITGICKDIPSEHIAWITVVVPLMSPSQYKEAFEVYSTKVIKDKTHDSLFAANLLKEYLWNDSCPINYCADKNHTISQNLPDIYRVTNGLYMRSKKDILREGYFLGSSPVKFIVPKIAGIDIDELEDYEISTHLFPYYQKNYSMQVGCE